jgi:hypothetical protein
MKKEELAAVIEAITGGNQSEYARLTGITGQQLRKLLAGTSGLSGQTETIAKLLLLCKENGMLDEAKKRRGR